MKQIILNIPDKDYRFFMDLFKKFPDIKVQTEDDLIITDEMKKVIDEELNIVRDHPEKLITWDKMNAKIKKRLKK